MIRRASLLASLRYILACAMVPGAALPFVVAFPAPAAEIAEQQNASVPLDPCGPQLAECTVTWSADSDYCEDKKDKRADGKCTSLLQCQAETLAAAKEYCEKACGAGGGKSGVESCGPCRWVTTSATSPCRKACEDKAEACEAECRKLPEDDKIGRRKCWKACNDDYAACIKKCKD